jgi:parallel beta-helix repeat protein
MIAPVLLLSFAVVGSASHAVNPPAGARNPAAVRQVIEGKRVDASAAWWGFDAEDSTAALQAAFDSKAKRVLIPYMGRPWIVRPLQLRGNQEVDLAPGVVIQAKRGEFQNLQDSLLTARDVSNLTIRGYGATLRMWKHDYQNAPYKKGEWRMGLEIQGSNHVLVEGLRVENSGGDGFYVDGSKSHLWSENVTIRDCVADSNHRQGISVISAVNLTVENCTFSNTEGTAPQAGIDLEPDAPNQRLQNIVIRNSVFENNQGSGMDVYLKQLNGSSAPVSILFDHCLSRLAEGAGGGSGISVGAVRDAGPKGLVEFRDTTVESAGMSDVTIAAKSADGVRLRFVRCHWGRSWSSPHAEYSGPRVPILLVLRQPKLTHRLGGVDFVDCPVYDTVDRPALQVFEGCVKYSLKGWWCDADQTDYGVFGLHGRLFVQNPAGVRADLGPRPADTDLVVAAAEQ